MIPLPKANILAAYEARQPVERSNVVDRPMQCQLGRDPWKVAVASMLLCRTRRVQAEPVFWSLLYVFPGPEALARAEESLVQSIVRPCGLHKQRGRQLVRFSTRWFSEYDDLRGLPGVGLYVADAVGIFCFGDTALECSDGALTAWAQKLNVERLEAAVRFGEQYGLSDAKYEAFKADDGFHTAGV